jgi:hypothetical protein
VLLPVAVARAARGRLHARVFVGAALAFAVLGTLLVPLTWGMSLLLAPISLPLAVPGLWLAGWTRWLGVFAVLVNAALMVLLALIWVV